MEPLDCNFKDERGRQWIVKLTVPTLHQFCHEQRLTLQQLSPSKAADGQWGLGLTVDQLLGLAYAGTRYQARAVAHAESMPEFLEALDGPAFLAAQTAAVNALISFFLRVAPPPVQPAGEAATGNGAPSSA